MQRDRRRCPVQGVAQLEWDIPCRRGTGGVLQQETITLLKMCVWVYVENLQGGPAVQHEPLTLKLCVTVASLPGAAFVSAGYSLEATLCSLQIVALIVQCFCLCVLWPVELQQRCESPEQIVPQMEEKKSWFSLVSD